MDSDFAKGLMVLRGEGSVVKFVLLQILIPVILELSELRKVNGKD